MLACHISNHDKPLCERDGCKEKVHAADKESSGTDKGVEGRKKGYNVGWRPPVTVRGWGRATRFSSLPLDGGE